METSTLTVYSLNGLGCLFSLIIIGLAAGILANDVDFQLLNNGTFTLPIIILIVGILFLFVSTLGCVGAMRKENGLLVTYVVIVSILLLVGIVAGGMVIANPEPSKNIIHDSMIDTFNRTKTDANMKQVVDGLQAKKSCCGVDSAADWKKLGLHVPDSCCANQSCSAHFRAGCFEVLMDGLKKHAIAIGVVVVVFVIIQLTNVGCSIYIVHTG